MCDSEVVDLTLEEPKQRRARARQVTPPRIFFDFFLVLFRFLDERRGRRRKDFLGITRLLLVIRRGCVAQKLAPEAQRETPGPSLRDRLRGLVAGPFEGEGRALE